jgi:hypothetical protein
MAKDLSPDSVDNEVRVDDSRIIQVNSAPESKHISTQPFEPDPMFATQEGSNQRGSDAGHVFRYPAETVTSSHIEPEPSSAVTRRYVQRRSVPSVDRSDEAPLVEGTPVKDDPITVKARPEKSGNSSPRFGISQTGVESSMNFTGQDAPKKMGTAATHEAMSGKNKQASIIPESELAVPRVPSSEDRRSRKDSPIAAIRSHSRQDDRRAPDSSEEIQKPHSGGAHSTPANQNTPDLQKPQGPLVSEQNTALPEPLERCMAGPEPPVSTTTIRVTIGRVEVRAITPPAPASQRTAPKRTVPALSLDEYLKQRNGG